MKSPFFHSLNTNGPVPIGALRAGCVVKSFPSYTCFGNTCDSYELNAASSIGVGSDRRRITVEASGVSTVVTLLKVIRPRGCSFFQISSRENLTSAEVNGLPSCQVTPRLSLNV